MLGSHSEGEDIIPRKERREERGGKGRGGDRRGEKGRERRKVALSLYYCVSKVLH